MGKCPRCKARVFVKLYCPECFKKEIEELEERLESADTQSPPGPPWALEAMMSNFKPQIIKNYNRRIGESWISYSPNIRNPFWTLYHVTPPIFLLLLLGSVFVGTIWLYGLLSGMA
jgi:hypothetical protein